MTTPTPLAVVASLDRDAAAVLAAARQLATDDEAATHANLAAATRLEKAAVDAAVAALRVRGLVAPDLDGPRRHRRPRAVTPTPAPRQAPRPTHAPAAGQPLRQRPPAPTSPRKDPPMATAVLECRPKLGRDALPHLPS